MKYLLVTGLFCVSLAACSSDPAPPTGTDAGAQGDVRDAGAAEDVGQDSGVVMLDIPLLTDAPTLDVPPPDAGASDAGARDATGSDTPSADAGNCAVVTQDTSAIGRTCGASEVMCPVGYTCASFSGIVLQRRCEIPCARDCECPSGHTCAELRDKNPQPQYFCRPSSQG